MATESRPAVGRRLQAMVLGIVPGLAHVVLLDRTGVGTVQFVLFMAGVDAAVAGRYLLDREWSSDLFTAGCVVAAAAWLWSWIDMVRLTLLRNYEKRARLRDTLSSEGVRHYAAGSMEKAHASFRACLALDHRDADVLFWYACVEARRGKEGRARRAFRRCRRFDVEGKWAFLAGEEEARLAETVAAARRARAAAAPAKGD